MTRTRIGVRVVGDLFWTAPTWLGLLEAKHVPLKDWQYRYVAYDRKRRILELGLNTDAAYQHRGVPLDLALGIVRAESPAEFCKQSIDGKFPFDRVRILHQFLLMLARELEALLPA